MLSKRNMALCQHCGKDIWWDRTFVAWFDRTLATGCPYNRAPLFERRLHEPRENAWED